MYGFLLLLFISKSFSLVTPFHVDNQIAVIFVKAVSLHFIQEVPIMPFLQNLHSLFYSEMPANVPFRQFLTEPLIEPFDFCWEWKADLHIDDITAMNLLCIYLHNELILLNTIDGFIWPSKAQ